MTRAPAAYTVRVYVGRTLVDTVRGFSTRSAAAARASRESRGVRTAIVGASR